MEQPITTSQAEADWQQFKAVGCNAAAFVTLLAITEGKVAEAIVLWELLVFHTLTKRGLDADRERSASEIYREHGTGVTSIRSIRLAFQNLEANGLVAIKRGVRNTTMAFRVNWPLLWQELEELPWWMKPLGQPTHQSFSNDSCRRFIKLLAARNGVVSEAVVLWYCDQAALSVGGQFELNIRGMVERFGRLCRKSSVFEAITALSTADSQAAYLEVSPSVGSRHRQVRLNLDRVEAEVARVGFKLPGLKD